MIRQCLLWALAAPVSAQLVLNPRSQDNGGHGSAKANSLPVNISALFDNQAFALSSGGANFDGSNNAYPAENLPPPDFICDGVRFAFPQYHASRNDNVIAQGQSIDITKGRYSSVYMLAASEGSIAAGSISATYDDGSSSSASVLVEPWWQTYPGGGDIIFPAFLTSVGEDYNRSMIYATSYWLDNSRDLVQLQLPVAIGSSRMHIFAMSLVSSNAEGGGLKILHARSTQMWLDGTDKTQIIEATVLNAGDKWILGSHNLSVHVEAPGLSTVNSAVIKRLRPGDQTIVQVGVVNTAATVPGTHGPATLMLKGNNIDASYTFNATYGISTYDATFDSIYQHESPMWYNNAKYGIFIHWGIYSVPGWGNTGKNENYAEWYWYDMDRGPSLAVGTYEYNLRTYGPNHEYDEFMNNFTATAFDPKEWVDLFADAGARYFVQVTKHHDGFSLFDLPNNVSQRTSMAQPPHRNLVKELFNAAQIYQPQLRRATYYSLPEWYNPSYKPYGFGDWPGGNASNPYSNISLPYTGYVEIEHYLEDFLLPSMFTLADMGTEMMWCDIGGPNLTIEFAAQYFNMNAAKGRQVVMNNRCGLPGDFDTPEYARYSSVLARKWESNLGMDPYSYGYNRATPTNAYMKPGDIVTSLVDIVSKNGNFLLDIGPTGNGTIIEIEQFNLRTAGKWIQSHAEAIFDTTYWFVTPEEGDAIRFTRNADAFYILTLYPPNSTLTLRSPVPYYPGDRVVVVGGQRNGTVVPSKLLADGSLEISISKEIRAADEYSWVFKIPYT